MNLTISPPIRIAAIAGLLLAVVFGGYMMMLGRSHSPSATQTPRARTQDGYRAPLGFAREGDNGSQDGDDEAEDARGRREGRHGDEGDDGEDRRQAHGRQAHAAKQPPRSTPPPTAATSWTRPCRRRSSGSSRSTRSSSSASTTPIASVDAISVAEAHAGAVEAGAGFLLVNVLDNSLAGLLTGVLPSGGLLPDPGVLIYRAPGTLALRIDGFADRDAIAQAATDALAGQDGPTTAPSAPTLTTP